MISSGPAAVNIPGTVLSLPLLLVGLFWLLVLSRRWSPQDDGSNSFLHGKGDLDEGIHLDFEDTFKGISKCIIGNRK